MTRAISSYNVKLLVQVDMPSSQEQCIEKCTETTNASDLLINTLYEVHAVPLSQHTQQHAKLRNMQEVSIQQSVLKVWKHIRRSSMKHSLSDIPPETLNDVQKLLQKPMSVTQQKTVLPIHGLLCGVTHAYVNNDTTQSVDIGTSDVQVKDVTIKTQVKTLHLRHTQNNILFTLTAILIPAASRDSVSAQHFVQLQNKLPVRANDVLSIYGKRMQANSIQINPRFSHKMNRDALRYDHTSLCKELGLTTTPKTTTHCSNVLYNTFVTTTDQSLTFDISCFSVYM